MVGPLPGYKQKPAGESQQAFLLLGPVQRPEESQWVLSAGNNRDKAIKSLQHEQARFGPLPDYIKAGQVEKRGRVFFCKLAWGRTRSVKRCQDEVTK